MLGVERSERLRAGLRAMRAGSGAQRGMNALANWHGAEAAGDRRGAAMARARLLRHTAGYHSQVATDPVRLAAWDAALRSMVKPGMLALEIGTGCGVLAMLAARAGATVVACESDPVIAAIGAETVVRNGFAGQIAVLHKRLEDLRIPGDLPRPADLLFTDIFADDLFGFDPFAVLRAAAPLLAPGAVRLPARVALVGALAEVPGWERLMPAEVAGLDVSPLRAVAPAWDRFADFGSEAALRSAPAVLVEAALDGALPAPKGRVEHSLASTGGGVNGVALWLRLELAPGIVLEAAPGLNGPGYYAHAGFAPFDALVPTARGEALGIDLAWSGRRLAVARGAR